jgi:hypothetical protein
MKLLSRDYVVENSPKTKNGDRGARAAHMGEVALQIGWSFFSVLIVQPTGRCERRRTAQNGSKRVFWCKDVPFGGLVDS